MAWIKSTLFILILAVLAIPAFQKLLKIVPSVPLEGYFVPSPKPPFSLKSLIYGEYRDLMTPHLERTIGFHNDFTRLFNQVDFSLFSIPHAAKIVVGKNQCLQADSHINAFLGLDFVGKKYIDDKVARLKYLQDYFWTKKHVMLLVILAPGKGYFYPESIPNRFLKLKKPLTNDSCYSAELKKNGINLIDFNQWLISLKDTSKHVLYPKTGIHWSQYGAWLCADSLQKYLAAKLNRPIPRMVPDSLVQDPLGRRNDYDMDRVMNLLWRIPIPVMTYPVFHFVGGGSQPKPAALFISDSFYWFWHDNGFIKNTFSNREMWYYDMEVYPEQRIRQTNTAFVDLDKAVSRQDVVILMQTNAAYGNPSYGFVDRAFEYYYPGKTPVKRILEVFRSNEYMMDMVKKKAIAQKLPLEAVMMTDAIYLYNNQLKRSSKYN
ncbi:MAG: hypothetical protein WCJ26_11125 [bacterium]